MIKRILEGVVGLEGNAGGIGIDSPQTFVESFVGMDIVIQIPHPGKYGGSLPEASDGFFVAIVFGKDNAQQVETVRLVGIGMAVQRQSLQRIGLCTLIVLDIIVPLRRPIPYFLPHAIGMHPFGKNYLPISKVLAIKESEEPVGWPNSPIRSIELSNQRIRLSIVRRHRHTQKAKQQAYRPTPGSGLPPYEKAQCLCFYRVQAIRNHLFLIPSRKRMFGFTSAEANGGCIYRVKT